MKEKSAHALKEWAAIEQVIAAGGSSLLLRKGGLWERREGFEIEHREFWLFPTLYHQNPHELRPEFAWALESARAAHPNDDRVRLEHYALVTDAFKVERIETLERLAGFHALTSETIEARFQYKNRPYLHAVLLRTYRAPEPRIIPNTLGYEGCVSWVELDEALSTAGMVPVIGDEEFASLREDILGQLRGADGVTAVAPSDRPPG